MDGSLSAMPEESASPGVAIPLDLTQPISPYREQEGLSIKVSGLPFKARLSKGRNNGDNSWSLTLNDLDDLLYIPPGGLATPHTLTVSLIGIEDDTATTLMRFDVPIAAGAPPPAPAPAPDEFQPAGPIGTDPNIYTGNTAPETPAAVFPPASDQLNSGHAIGEVPPAPLNGYPASHINPPQQQTVAPPPPPMAAPAPVPANEFPNSQVAALHEQAVAAVAQANAATGLPGYKTTGPATQPVGASTDMAQEIERRLTEARGAWESEYQGRVAAAVQEAVQRTEANARAQLEQTTEVRLAMELERRLAEARTSWESELQGRVAAAVQEVEQRVRSEVGTQNDQTNEARLAQEVERRLAEARATWEAEFQGRVAASVDQAVQQTRAEFGAQQNHENETRLAQEVERRLAEARATWEAEAQGRVSAAVQEAVQKTDADVRAQLTQANEAQLAEVLQRRLGEARASWEPELQGRVAAAVQESVQRSEASFQGRLEQAQHQWREASARELAEMSARCTQAEAALTALRNQPPQGQVNEEALRAMSAELAAAQALVRARETELGESRHSLERARSEISTYAKDAETIVERNRAAWSAEREILLAQAEENAQQRVRQALERWQFEAEAAMTKAQQEWAADEATRFAIAESEWRENIGIAKSRAPITKLTKKRSRIHISGRFKLFAAIAAGLAMLYMFYPRIEPVVDHMWPKIIEYKGEIEPSVRETTTEVKSWLSDAVKKSKEAVKGKNKPNK